MRRARTVGLEHTLIALSADHGMPEMPEAVAEAGFPAGRLYPEDVVDRANRAARRRFGIEEVVRFFFRPYLYLDRERIRASGTDPDEVEREIAVALASINGIALAVARSALPTLAGTDLVARVRRNTHPSRSGDIYVVQEPYWFLYEKGRSPPCTVRPGATTPTCRFSSPAPPSTPEPTTAGSTPSTWRRRCPRIGG